MKKVFLMCVAMALTMAAQAQDPMTGVVTQGHASHTMGAVHEMSATDMATKHTDYLTKQLGLNAMQKEKVMTACMSACEHKMKRGEHGGMRMDNKMDKAFAGIFTEKQLADYHVLQAQGKAAPEGMRMEHMNPKHSKVGEMHKGMKPAVQGTW